jgi:hypothetical protein
VKLLSSLILAATLFTAGGAFANDKAAPGHDHKNCECSESCPHHDKQASKGKEHVCTTDCSACTEGKECNDKTCNHEGHGKSKSKKKS